MMLLNLRNRNSMPKSLLEQLPEIVAKGKQEAERILEGLEGRHRVGLQTREWVLPAKDTATTDWIAQNQRAGHLEKVPEGTHSAGADKAPAQQGGRAKCALLAAADGGTANGASEWANRLIYGDNLLAMAALLAGDETHAHACAARST